MAPGSELSLSPHWRRGVQEDIASIPETLKSWDSCMAKEWCKYPVIAACVVGGLVLISMTWCCYRCCCRRRRKAKRSKSTFFNDPVPAYMTSGTTPTPNSNVGNNSYNSNSRNSIDRGNTNAAPSAVQYAYFETGTTNPKNNDDLPVMPSWGGAKSEKVEDTSVEVIELTEVDNNGRQQQPPSNNHVNSNMISGQTNPTPSATPAPVNRPPLAADPSQYHSQPHRQNFPPPSNNMNMNNGMHNGMNNGMNNGTNPFGPQRLNSPFAPSNRLPMAAAPPTRTQSPYPETSNMPNHAHAHAHAPHNGGAPTLNLDFDFSPHINAHNQGPYANADIYPPEPAYQPPQFSGTTAPTPAPPPQQQQPQQSQFTGTTSVTPAPAGYAEAYSSPPRQQTIAHTPTVTNANIAHNGFMAQMDDDFGHSPVHLTQPGGGGTANPAPVFDPNAFDHGGYGGYGNNQASAHVADGFHGHGHDAGYQRPMNGNNGFNAQQPPQAWSAF
ncbi:hypothetical protein Dda_3792 [Drechslerella dactyloides]|uniref:Fibroin-3 related protein n=1 Tax=Drechslerella dactyloides TaxID=74499 RepID=A0AAD6NK39_DREDA|nr:hypothetical protein Dda_3792 [Drechslerella dactyloides]